MGVEFPAFLKLEYQRGAAGDTLLAEVNGTLDRAEGRFREFSGEASRLVDVALGKGRSGGAALNFDVAGLRDFAREQQNAAVAARELANATRLAAEAAGDDSQRARASIAATEAEARAREEAARAARNHADAIEQIQAAAQRSNVTQLTGQYLALARAEAAAAEGARQIAAISAATGLDRQAKSARDSAAAFELMFQAQAANDERAAQSFLNTAFGLDRQAKSARDSAAAFQELFAVQDRNAASADTLRAAIDPLYAAQKRFDQEMRTADDLLEAGAISAREYAQAQELARQSLRGANDALFVQETALKQGTTAQRNVINSTSALRQATLQAGQQVQDIGISLYSGQRASVVFTQQLPQLAFALTGLEGSANKTQDRIGRFATFLSGPWGLAVGLAVGAATTLVAQLLGMGEESDKTKEKTLGLADALDKSRFATDEGRKAIEDYNAAQAGQRDNAERMIKLNLAAAESDFAAAVAKRERIKADLEFFEQASRRGAQSEAGEVARAGAFARADRARAGIDFQQSEIDKLGQAVRNLRIEDARREAEGASDPLKRINNLYDDMAAAAERAAAGNDTLSKSLSGTLTTIERQRSAAIRAQREADRSSGGRARDPGELTNFISPVAGGRVTGRFGEDRGDRRHGGIDIAVPVGTNVRAPAGGIVIEAGNLPGYGNVVFIDHGGGTVTRLAHLSRVGVSAGARVDQGDIIGLSGGERGAPGAGNSRGPHVHQETRVNGRAVDPLKGRFATDQIRVAERAQAIADKAAEAAAKAQQQLITFGERAASSISNINARFDEQPRLVDAAAAATKDLNDLIAELDEKLKDKSLSPEFAAQLRAARDEAIKTLPVVQDALVRPIRELAEENARRAQIDALLLAGREREAAILQAIWQIEQQRGALRPEERAQVEAIVLAEERRVEVVRRLQQQQSAYLDATRSVRQELENLFSGEKVDFGRVFKRLQAQVTVENLFGDALRKLDFDVQAKFDTTGLQRSADTLKDVFYDLGDAGRAAAAGLSGRSLPGLPANDNAPSSNPYGDDYGFQKAFFDLFGGRGAPEPDNVPITVSGTRGDAATARAIEKSAIGLSPSAYADMLGRALVRPLLQGLPQAIAGPLSGILGGAAGGYATAGAPGAVIGLARGLFDEIGPKLFGNAGKGISDALEGALKGAQTGSLVSGIGNSLGLKLNQTGSQIGGALGGALSFIPGGGIIGSIAGGLLGNLFGKRPRGAGSVSNAAVTGSTNDSALTQDLLGSGQSIQGSIKKIADALGVEVGAYSIGLGRYKDYYQVSSRAGDPALGNSYFNRKSSSALYDGTDPAAAAAAAIGAAIAQGAIKGLSETANRILKNTPDIDQAVQKILDFNSVFKRLREIKDPVSAAMDELDKEFGRLRGIFDSAGASAAEYAQLEELYGIERAKAIKDAGERSVGSLRSLLNDLKIGDNGLSLRDRQSNALIEYNALQSRVKAGDVTAYDDFAQRARDLLDIERQLFGSTKTYFDRFNEVKDISQGVVDAQQKLIDQAQKRDAGLDAGVVRDSIESQTQQLGQKLDAVNDNLIALAGFFQSAGAGNLADRYGLRVSL